MCAHGRIVTASGNTKRKITITMAQDQKIFKHLMAMLTKTKLQGRRHAICWEYSNGRTESSKELSNTEMLTIIHDLEKGFKELDRCDVMRKKIISMAHEMGWRVKSQDVRSKSQDIKPKIDIQRVDNWCVKYGAYHKGLNAHNYTELVHLLSQFEQFYQSFLHKLQ